VDQGKCKELQTVAADCAMDKGAFEKVCMAHRVSPFKATKKRKRGLPNNPVPILDDLVDLQTIDHSAGAPVQFPFGQKPSIKHTKSLKQQLEPKSDPGRT